MIMFMHIQYTGNTNDYNYQSLGQNDCTKILGTDSDRASM